MNRLVPVLCLFSCLIGAQSFAGSATWNLNPTSGDWNTAANWTPATVPNGPDDVAFFGTSAITELTLSSPIVVASSVYDADADGFTISNAGIASLTFAGAGIINPSTTPQSFVVDVDEANSGGLISFTNSATISGLVNFTVAGQNRSGNPKFAMIEFHDNSSAGTASFVCEAGQRSLTTGGNVFFFDSASAGTGQFICEGAPSRDALPGQITFEGSSTAGNGTFTLNPGTLFGGGQIIFTQSATAGQGTFTINGGAMGSNASFQDTSTAGDATFIVNGSDLESGFGGGVIAFGDDSSLGNSTIIINSGERDGGHCVLHNPVATAAPSVSVFGNGTLFGNGELSIDLLSGEMVSIGSLEGDGYLSLDHGTLMVGTNNRSTQFDGTIFQSGSLTKVGTGTLTLTGENTRENTYSGVTTILGGTLRVNNTAGSGTGSGAVKVSNGTLSGRGIISGKVTVGTGSGTGGVIAPSEGASNPTTLTLQNQLIFQSNGSYLFRLNTNKATADQVIASGITIKSGAQFNFKTVGNKKLTVGTVSTAISNTATTPIGGTFANLADAATVTLGRNKLQVSYSGGDGNDLTLTVVP